MGIYNKEIQLSENVKKYEVGGIISQRDKHTDKVNIEYDFTKKNAEDEENLCSGWVCFDFILKKEIDMPKKELNYRLNQLATWTKFLFWKDTEVRYKKNGKKWLI